MESSLCLVHLHNGFLWKTRVEKGPRDSIARFSRYMCTIQTDSRMAAMQEYYGHVLFVAQLTYHAVSVRSMCMHRLQSGPRCKPFVGDMGGLCHFLATRKFRLFLHVLCDVRKVLWLTCLISRISSITPFGHRFVKKAAKPFGNVADIQREPWTGPMPREESHRAELL